MGPLTLTSFKRCPPFVSFFSISALTGADLPNGMLIAYLWHPSLFNLLTHFLFRAQQQIHFLSLSFPTVISLLSGQMP